MRTIIAGSRVCTNAKELEKAMDSFLIVPTVVLSGRARGADRLGEAWAQVKGIPLELYPAKWNLYGKRAGFMRNEEMAKNAEALVALWDGVSRGTLHMITTAKNRGLNIFIHLI